MVGVPEGGTGIAGESLNASATTKKHREDLQGNPLGVSRTDRRLNAPVRKRITLLDYTVSGSRAE